MSLSRREFLQMLAMAGVAGTGLGGRHSAHAAAPANLYEVPPFSSETLPNGGTS